MNCGENESTSRGTRNYCGVVTSRYKKYCPAILVGFSRISDGLVYYKIGESNNRSHFFKSFPKIGLELTIINWGFG